MGLSLLAGPANAGKVALLLERYLGALESDPFLIVPNRPELDRAQRELLTRPGVWNRELERRYAAERIASELAAWDGKPVFAYGFEDLTGAEWALLEALSGRSEATVSLPYEPGRDAFASLRRTADDLSALAENVEELPPNPAARSPVLAHLERT